MANTSKDSFGSDSPYSTLDKLCDEFERCGYHRNKQHIAAYEKLLDASTLIFGSPNDPLNLHTKVDHEEGKKILTDLKSSFDAVAASEKRLGDDAILFKKKHRYKSRNFSNFSCLLGKVLQHL